MAEQDSQFIIATHSPVSRSPLGSPCQGRGAHPTAGVGVTGNSCRPRGLGLPFRPTRGQGKRRITLENRKTNQPSLQSNLRVSEMQESRRGSWDIRYSVPCLSGIRISPGAGKNERRMNLSVTAISSSPLSLQQDQISDRPEGFRLLLDAAAKYLGLSTRDLLDQTLSGKSLAEVAPSSG